MAGVIRQFALACTCTLGLAACGSVGDYSDQPSKIGEVSSPDHPLQCVPYARQISGVNIWGYAYTWWDKAAGKFVRSSQPRSGAVMVLNGYAGANRAHLAVVRDIVNGREIKVDHANWLDDGAIYVDDPVVDVSSNNDWSQVRVWNIRARAWGSRIYPVQGFIGPGPETGEPVPPAYDDHQVISLN